MDSNSGLHAFVVRHGWGNAGCLPLAGDASGRVYYRLVREDGTAVLMDAHGTGDVDAFVTVAGHLRALGLRPPSILAQEPGLALLLLEDLGDAVAAKVLAGGVAETAIYDAAIDLLARLQAAPPPPGLPDYDDAWFIEEADRYLRFACPDLAEDAKTAYAALWPDLIARARVGAPGFVYIDYHVENLIWDGAATGTDRLRLLDFQGARLGPAAYDVASLVEDARRDVPKALRRRAIDRYLAGRGDLDAAAFEDAVTILCAQRHLKVLGIFHRLANEGRTGYRRHIPRVEAYLRRNIKADVLHPLREWCLRYRPSFTVD